MAATGNETKIRLKIMVDMKEKKVLFAESDQDFVNFIIGLMTLSLSKVTRLLLQSEKDMVGSLGALYNSIVTLDTRGLIRVDNAGLLGPRSVGHQSLFSHLAREDTLLGQMRRRYVSAGAIYMVTDNLEVKLLSMAVVKSLVRDFDELEEKQIEVGPQEAIAILKASLETTNVLTTVFLGKNI